MSSGCPVFSDAIYVRKTASVSSKFTSVGVARNWRKLHSVCQPFSRRFRAAAASPNHPSEHGKNSMEVEIKLKLPDSAAHQRLSDILSPFHLETLIQENAFFDSPVDDLAKNLAALRLRFYNLDSRCVLSLKAKPVISSGISRVEEEEEPLEPILARRLVAEPSRILAIHASNIARRVREEYGVRDLVCLGKFRNVRGVYEWEGLKLEVDETTYDFGTSYEVECETAEPERDRKLIEGLLIENGIRYNYSNLNKFAVFRSGKLP
ncbi:hypothetical protein SAY86_000485 [Trapa natans]|nr:hypothetical protein SAY86_000485 [Trapa natans]